MDLDKKLKEKVLLLDGATGSELQNRGYPTVLPLWSATANLDAPNLVKQIHADYIHAGADIISTNTFRTTQYAYAKTSKKEEAFISLKSAVKLAKEARKESGRDVLIAGSLTTLEDCYKPQNTPDRTTMFKAHKQQIAWLADQGIDLLLLETMNNIAEAVITAEIASETSLPVFISFITNGQGQLLSGEGLNEAINGVAKYNPTAILLNCRSLDTIDKDITILRSDWDGFIGAYANGYGNADDDWGWVCDDEERSLKDFLIIGKKWLADGINIIGGCCGTTPKHISGLRSLIKNTD